MNKRHLSWYKEIQITMLLLPLGHISFSLPLPGPLRGRFYIFSATLSLYYGRDFTTFITPPSPPQQRVFTTVSTTFKTWLTCPTSPLDAWIISTGLKRIANVENQKKKNKRGQYISCTCVILVTRRKKLFKRECNTRTSQEVTHPSTTLAQARLTSEFWWDPVL